MRIKDTKYIVSLSLGHDSLEEVFRTKEEALERLRDWAKSIVLEIEVWEDGEQTLKGEKLPAYFLEEGRGNG